MGVKIKCSLPKVESEVQLNCLRSLVWRVEMKKEKYKSGKLAFSLTETASHTLSHFVLRLYNEYSPTSMCNDI